MLASWNIRSELDLRDDNQPDTQWTRNRAVETGLIDAVLSDGIVVSEPFTYCQREDALANGKDAAC